VFGYSTLVRPVRSDQRIRPKRRIRRWVLALWVAVAVMAIVIGEGMMGSYDKYFTVKLVNRTGSALLIDTVRVRPGSTDLETGSSTAHQPVTIQLGQQKKCADLFFRHRPSRPLPIVLRRGQLSVRSAASC
jgi:hypothetical protein